MIFHVKYTKGLLNPQQHFSSLREAEGVKGIIWRTVVSALLIGVLTGVSMYLLSGQMSAELQAGGLSPDEAAVFTNIISVLNGIFVAGISVIGIVIAALVFWIFFKDVGFKNLFIIFVYFLPIYVLVMLIDLPFIIYFDLEQGISMTSLGFIAEQIWDHSFFVMFFSQVSLWFIWCFLVQVFALKVNTAKSTRYIVTVTAIAYVMVMLLMAGISMFGMTQGV
ncbi:hypothetical protein HNR44_003018 [Geomicrobium halophilum]|uniref:Yip1 domain-containing protein n=1 Tax=Geomicrobium halophilum TaxID=549000 RepID=A0A841Q2P5_9BACL|nr:hypothetical protein [Geomicrobium halophilum]MBB6451028.1 hypothetical protein [Geomicrobium halophilum]